MRFLRNSLRNLLIAAAAMAVVVWLSLSPGDPDLWPPRPGAPTVKIHVVSHGWHTGLIVGVGDLGLSASRLSAAGQTGEAEALWSLARTMVAAEWVEVGWGDKGFYFADVATAAEVPPMIAAEAFFLPTPTVMHVFPGLGPPPEAFPASEVRPILMSEPGFDAFAAALAQSFGDTRVTDLGRGLYGYARFFEGSGVYTGLRTCNNWTADMLRAGGVPASWITSGTSWGLMAELDARVY